MERTKAAVADASVIARWYVKEDSYKKALEVRRDYEENRLSLIELFCSCTRSPTP